MSDSETAAIRPSNPKQRNVRIEIGPSSRDYVSGGQRVTMVPLTIRRKQRRKVMTPPPGSNSVLSSGGEDISMIRTLGKAFYWHKLLEQGKFASCRDLAAHMKLEHGWAAEVLRMTMLAPDIIEAILDGRQPRHLNLQRLRGRHDPLPRVWGEQRRLLGFSD
jgi:hypothetical protein